MARKNKISTSVIVSIDTSKLSHQNKQRLRQILGRDSRIISRYIGVIEDNRKELVEYKEKKNGKISIKIDKGKLDQLTCTTSDRKIVVHDLKIQFPRISLNELKECRDTAVGMYLSYLELEAKGNASIPTAKSSFPRSIGYRRFKLRYHKRTLTIMDSMDTNPSMINNGKKKIQHDKLTFNLDLKKYDICKIMEGSLQAVRIIRSRRNYYAIFAIRHEVKQLTSKYPKKSNKELAIAGIDLGINRDAVISIITAHGVSQHKFIKLERIENTKQSILKLDKRIAEIQHKVAKRSTDKEQTDGLYSLLRELRSERSELKYEISHQLSAEINKYLLSLTDQYDLWIGIGKLKGIRASIPTAKSSFPRSIGYRRFKLRYHKRTLTIMDSMDTNPSMINNGKKKIQHDKLTFNLDLKKYDICKIMEGSLQAVRIIRSRRNYYAIFAIRHEVKQLTSKYPKKSNKELAIAGIDLGINRDAVISIITAHGVSQHKFIKLERIENTKQSILKLDKRIAEIQHKVAKRSTDKEQTDGLYSLLRELRSERSELKYEISHQLSAEINKYLLSLTDQYDLWIGIGKLKGIRRGQRRGNGNKRHRKRMHRWAYGQLTWMLEYKLSKSGYKRRFLTIPEGWTSIKCWKCNTKGKRPKQEYFKCKNRTCKWMGNADFNGATNIAKRAAKYFKLTTHLKSSLFEVSELGSAEPKTMKVFNKNNTRGSSNLSNNLSGRNAVNSDQAMVKNHGNPSLLISFFKASSEGEDDRNTDLILSNKNKSRTLLASQEVVVTPDSVCGT
ncbi:MAG: hypothetical protein HeimC2_14800 [Candidatus Heimdallarchaeota archaeon LC_2]|nr:MAG: hypothetical protein HeimC2_14800 [Candidatus Heimdallarchaeota archaeon LC_2]